MPGCWVSLNTLRTSTRPLHASEMTPLYQVGQEGSPGQGRAGQGQPTDGSMTGQCIVHSILR